MVWCLSLTKLFWGWLVETWGDGGFFFPVSASLSGSWWNGVSSKLSLIFFMILWRSQLCLDPQQVSHKMGRFVFYEFEMLENRNIKSHICEDLLKGNRKYTTVCKLREVALNMFFVWKFTNVWNAWLFLKSCNSRTKHGNNWGFLTFFLRWWVFRCTSFQKHH